MSLIILGHPIGLSRSAMDREPAVLITSIMQGRKTRKELHLLDQVCFICNSFVWTSKELYPLDQVCFIWDYFTRTLTRDTWLVVLGVLDHKSKETNKIYMGQRALKKSDLRLVSSIERIVSIFQNAEIYYSIMNDRTSTKWQRNEFPKIIFLSRAIPTPKLLLKIKKPNNKCIFPTRLVVSVTNFTSAFPKIGYIDIKKLLDSNNVNYQNKIIIQASDLKENLEEIDLKKNECT